MATIHPQKKRNGAYSPSINEYKRRTQKICLFNFSKIYDPDVIEWLERNKPYQTAIKQLIRDQIKREEQREKRKARKASKD